MLTKREHSQKAYGKLGHLPAYPCLQVISEQIEKYWSQDRSLGHTAFHLSPL